MVPSFDKECTGFYQDAEWIRLKNYNDRSDDCARKNLKIFENCSVNLEVTSDLKTVNFLDFTFDLNNHIWQPY